MFKDKTFACVIPARGGSSLKDKNIRPIAGQPLIAWSIKAAKDAGIFDRIVVSTDSAKIAEVAEQAQCEVQMRPASLATDMSPVRTTMQHVCANLGQEYNYVLLKEPTSPLVEGVDIIKAVNVLVRQGGSFLISVCESDVPLGVAKPIPESGRMTDWFPLELRNRCRQEVTQAYQLDGNLYLGKWHIWADNIDYWNTEIFAFKMPKDKHCHIDDEVDFKVAEYQMMAMHERRAEGVMARMKQKFFRAQQAESTQWL